MNTTHHSTVYSHAPRPMRGLTLIEIMVAVVVISVGLLGVAALQITSLRNNQNSYFRTQVTLLTQDIIDRMRANRSAALAGDYNIALGASINLTGTDTRAQIDLAEWKATLLKELPALANGTAADGAISINAARIVTITVTWSERATANNANDATSITAAENIQFVTRTEI